MAAGCHDFTDFSNLIGMNQSCKMRWTGQWPGAQPQLSNVDVSQQHTMTAGAIGTVCDDLSNQQRPQPNEIMAIDQLHQQIIQQQLCSEQFQLLNQLQVCHSGRCYTFFHIFNILEIYSISK